jgi:hypothetical protein
MAVVRVRYEQFIDAYKFQKHSRKITSGLRRTFPDFVKMPMTLFLMCGTRWKLTMPIYRIVKNEKMLNATA